MIAEARFQIKSAFIAVAVAAWLTASTAQIESIAVAAEVNAIGVPAPVDFAGIVERVKPAVVGVQVKIEGVTTSDEPQQEAPPPHRSPLDRFFRHFGIPMPDAPFPSQASRWARGSSSPVTATSSQIITSWPTG